MKVNKMKVTLPSGDLVLNVESTEIHIDELCGFACRQNPKRGFLFVSKILGKHYPVKPSIMKKSYEILSEKVRNKVKTKEPMLFLGFAETATGLGAGLFESWNNENKQESLYLHTTRYEFEKEVLFRFHEEHSHATAHIVYKPDNDFNLGKYKTLVLIDDEMTTGKTAMNFIEKFIKLDGCSINKIIVVCLKNWMSESACELFKKSLPSCDVEFIHILKGNYEFIKNENYVCTEMPKVDSNGVKKDFLIDRNYGRFGLGNIPKYNFDSILSGVTGKKILVLGTGEFSYFPYKIAEFLENNGIDVVYQSTTRSPILLGGIITEKIEFKDNYGENISNFVYNVSKEKYDEILICYETNEKFNFDLDKKINAKNIFFKDLELIE